MSRGANGAGAQRQQEDARLAVEDRRASVADGVRRETGISLALLAASMLKTLSFLCAVGLLTACGGQSRSAPPDSALGGAQAYSGSAAL